MPDTLMFQCPKDLRLAFRLACLKEGHPTSSVLREVMKGLIAKEGRIAALMSPREATEKK